MFDNILNQPWSEWDEDQFNGVANHEDVYSFVENALFPALIQDEWPMAEPPQKKTAAEIAESMDTFDWSAGLSFRQARASVEPDSTCGTYQTMQMYAWLLTKNEATKVDGLTLSELEKTPRRFGPCYPSLRSQLGASDDATDDFGFNASAPGEPLLAPWKWFSYKELGTNPEGQLSASVAMQYNSSTPRRTQSPPHPTHPTPLPLTASPTAPAPQSRRRGTSR